MNVRHFLSTVAVSLHGRVRGKAAVFQDRERRPHSVVVLPYGADLYQIVLDREPIRVGRWSLQLGDDRELTVTKQELGALAKWLIAKFDAGREIHSWWSAAAWERQTHSKAEPASSYLSLAPST
jgi:hypothetical protein